MGSLSVSLIHSATLRSHDSSDTLDFSRQGLATVSDEAVDELMRVGKEGRGVRRLALSHNTLSSLPATFHLLGRLRYLNLKGNDLREIPEALTLLPALEILDLSRNKLSSLPPMPGRLLSLRVLSLSQNRLTTLPLYLADFTDLRVFKIDGNPLTFPDAALLRFRQGEEDEREWIDALREFLRVERDEGTSLPRYEETAPLGSTSPQTRAVQGLPLLDDGEDDDVLPLNARLPGAGPPGGNQQHRRVESSESGRSRVDLKDLVAMGQASQHRRMESSGSGSGRSRGDAGSQGGQGQGRGGGHRREDSDASLRGQVEVRSVLVDETQLPSHSLRGPAVMTTPPMDESTSAMPTVMPPSTATFHSSSGFSPSSGPSTPPGAHQRPMEGTDTPDGESELATPTAAAHQPMLGARVQSTDESNTPFAQFSNFSLSAPSPTRSTGLSAGSTRAAGGGGTSISGPSSHALSTSATMPLYTISPRQGSTDVLSSARGSITSTGSGHARHHSHSTSFLPPSNARESANPPVHRLGSKASSGSIHRLAFPQSGSSSRLVERDGGLNGDGGSTGRGGGPDRPTAPADRSTAQGGGGGPTGGGGSQPIEGSRDSYFRRLSTLPASTIPAHMPPSLLRLIDSARGLLFGLAQIQSTLRRNPTSPLDERFAGVLSRVLTPAAVATDGLINALDRFDSTSRRASQPPARVVRGVVEALKANVGAYGKVVAVLIIQLKLSSSKLVHSTSTSSLSSAPQPTASSHRENFEDIRFTRTLLLNLYGAMGEISLGWKSMLPTLPEISPLLRDPNAPPRHPLTTPTGTPQGRQQRLLSTTSSSRLVMSPVPERIEQSGSGTSPSVQSGAGGTGLEGLSPGTTPFPPSSNSVVPPLPTPSALSAQPNGPATNGTVSHHRTHSRTLSSSQSHTTHLHPREEDRRPSPPSPAPPLSSTTPTSGAFGQRPVDGQGADSPEAPDLAGQLLEEAVQTGFAVWNLMENDLQWNPSSNDHHGSRPTSTALSQPIIDLLSLISLARTHTRDLHAVLRSSSTSTAEDDPALIERATTFFQSVRQVGVRTKAVFESERREFRRDLKIGLGKLTRLTMESATLLHVSNLKRPGTSMSTYTSFQPDDSQPSFASSTPTSLHPFTPPSTGGTGGGIRPLIMGRSRSATGGALMTPTRAEPMPPSRSAGAGGGGFVKGHGGGKPGGRSVGGSTGGWEK